MKTMDNSNLFTGERPRLIAAPLEGISDEFWRDSVIRYGCEIVYTEMVSADATVRLIPKILEQLTCVKRQNPAVIQLFGRGPETMGEAAAICERFSPVAIDVNLGCPVPKIVKNGWGSALMKEPEMIRKIVRNIKSRTSTQLWLKMRLGWDVKTINYLQIAKMAEDEGVDVLALHARTRSQRFIGEADWDSIRQLKESVRIPVIGNGDIVCAGTAIKCCEQTGCDGVMIGRAALGSPWVFREILAALKGEPIPAEPSLEERRDLVLQHLEWMVQQRGEEKGVREMRKHINWYTKNISGCKRFREKIYQLGEREKVEHEINRFFDRKEVPELADSYSL